MIKKWTIALLSSAFLMLPLTTGSSYAAEALTSTTINNGQINNGRVLIPLRAVSENIGQIHHHENMLIWILQHSLRGLEF